jgi:hypothetical protein
MQDVGSQVTFKRPGNWVYLIKRPSGWQSVKGKHITSNSLSFQGPMYIVFFFKSSWVADGKDVIHVVRSKDEVPFHYLSIRYLNNTEW